VAARRSTAVRSTVAAAFAPILAASLLHSLLPAGVDSSGGEVNVQPEAHRRERTNGKGRAHTSSARALRAQREIAARVPRPEREAAAKKLRRSVPREEHERLTMQRGRDPLALIDATNAARIPELVPIRWGRMFESPFAFYRGAPSAMAFDLAHTPATGLQVQACGDAHLMNFGIFATPERNLIVDLNDFDETHPGPWEWDVKRLAVSLVVAAREIGSISNGDAKAAAQAAAQSYREHMRALAHLDPLSIYYERVEATTAAKMMGQTPAMIAKSEAKIARKCSEVVPKLTELVGDRMQIVTRPPVIQPLSTEASDEVRSVFSEYCASLRDDRRILAERYQIVDTALKVVGVGSVGTRCFIALLDADGAPFFLQIKEALPSVLAPYVGCGNFDHEGRRVVAGQRIMQAAGDVFLGWASHRTRAFYVRQYRDMKGGLDLATLDKTKLANAARLAGLILARAHARGGDPAAIAAYLGKSDAFDVAIAKFSVAYADQNEKDYAALKAAVRSGRIRALVGT
jgi:uncharacterized protein (DUF2252 family)